MAKANEMKRDIELRILIDHQTKSVLEKAAIAADRKQMPYAGILLARLLRIYERSPQTLVDLGIIAKSEHPELAAA